MEDRQTIINGWQFRWIDTWEEALSEKVRQDWSQRAYAAANTQVFMLPSLGYAWIETYRPLRNLKPLFIWADKGNQSIFFPLVLWAQNWKNAWMRRVVPVGYSDFDYTEPILNKQADTSTFFSSLPELLPQIVKVDSIQVPCLRSSFFEAEIFADTEVSCPFLRVDNHVQTPQMLISKGIKKDISRGQRGLAEKGDFTYKVIKDQKEALFCISELIHHYKLRYPNAYIPPKLHHNIILGAISSRVLHLSICSLNGRNISWRIGFKYDKCYYGYLPAFDADFHKYNIGNIHRWFTLEDASQSGLEVYDMLRGKKAYKDRWTQQAIDLNEWTHEFGNSALILKKGLLTIKELCLRH